MDVDLQNTICQEIVLSGNGLHTGNPVTIRIKPAPENSGIVFVRVDLPGKPRIKTEFENVVIDSRIPRCSSIGRGETVIHTVEHFMSALCGLGVDNLEVEIDNNELPGLDGSSLEFFKAIKTVGIAVQKAQREYITIRETIGVNSNGASILIVPDKQFKISYTLSYHHPYLRSQFFSGTIDQSTFERDIAPCRTFCLEEEARELREKGLGLGANYKNTLVVGASGVIENQVRFPDEFARHKVLDFIGDLYLLGKPLRGQVFAVKSGHHLNIELLKKIHYQELQYASKGFVPDCHLGAHEELDIQDIMRILPHRYPFLLVDRIIHLTRGEKIVGIKNVTINDQFFVGHFPTRPVMPGVLMVEALAQTGGVLALTKEEHRGKVALFMAVDKVKFRRLVEPGDQLWLEVFVVKDKSRTTLLQGIGKVAGKTVVEAEMLFSFTDAEFLSPLSS
jgi:UDP-3-O-[3-hydroxymyristoyl] N-acetylglucosamine deacetylase/3-hydroxyacyl-[acyl-carrier-protein] dehydratase